MNSANSRTSADLDLAPMTCLTTSPPENKMIVGTAITPWATMLAGFSSVFSFTTSTVPAYSSAIASSTGPTMRHGPHHGAQNSTITGTGLASTSAAKLSSVADFSTVAPLICAPRTGRSLARLRHDAHLPASDTTLLRASDTTFIVLPRQ